jgi:hypothetical protein
VLATPAELQQCCIIVFMIYAPCDSCTAPPRS